MRNRFLGTMLPTATLLLAVAVVLVWLGYRQLLSSNLFQLSSIEVQGNRAVLRQQIIETAGLRGRQVLIDIDCRALEEKLLGHPWIKSAQVRRRWPSTLSIAVAERRPLALVNLGNKGSERLHYLDSDGEVFAPVLASQDIDFPLLSGLGEELGVKKGKVAAESPAAEALLLLRLALGDPILPIQAISELHYDAGQGFVLYLTDAPFPVQLGRGGMRGKFRRLTAVLKDLYRRGSLEQVAGIRLDYMENRVLVAQRAP
ncbi:MAG: hypothetical protein BWK76_06930 [Desulfobulbaceae bacterium A2]|nr:MAG: hypothetical protein BWK76_06930 [Desulfobulbaceae bacterium A2]